MAESDRDLLDRIATRLTENSAKAFEEMFAAPTPSYAKLDMPRGFWFKARIRWRLDAIKHSIANRICDHHDDCYDY